MKPVRISVAHTLENRSETTDKDAKLQNGFVEVDETTVRAVKRPGLVSSYSLPTGQAGAMIGQMLMSIQTPSAPGIVGTSTLIGIRGDSLTSPVT